MSYENLIKKYLKEKDIEALNRTKTKKVSEAMLNILEKEILSFKYQQNKDLSYIYTLLDILGEKVSSNEETKRDLYTRFIEIHNNIKSVLHAKPEKMTKEESQNFEELKKIMDKLENTMLRINYDNTIGYDPDKEEFISYIIFKLKYIHVFNQATLNFPHIVNSTDKNGKPLIIKVLDEYLKALDIYLSKTNLGPLDDLIYYEKVLNIIKTSEKIKIDSNTKRQMLKKVRDFTANHNYEDSRRKEKLSFFINDISNIIIGRELPHDLDYLSYKYEVHRDFKQAHILEADTLKHQFYKLKGIETPRKIYTFDGEGAKEIDDGLSCILENGIYHLGVHIANPTAYIDYNSILMDEAKRRTTSLYMGDYCIPLFPFSISGDLMSLNQGQKRHCMSYYFDIDAQSGELLDFNIKNELCTITKNLTYNDFNNFIEHGTEDKDLLETLINLNNIRNILSRVYHEDPTYAEANRNPDRTNSELVVESAMIYTNYNVAKYFSDRDLPFIYRSHVVNNAELEALTKLQERLRDQSNTDKIIKNIEMIKSMFPRAYYTSENKGHMGLGIEFYSHVTSPLRRLADNIANMCIYKFILGEYTEEDIIRIKNIIDETAEIINKKRASLDDYQIQAPKYFKKTK